MAQKSTGSLCRASPCLVAWPRAQVATAKGRDFVGSEDGENLCEHCRPTWAGVPDPKALPNGAGSWQDRAKGASKLDVGKIDFLGFAHFMAHVMEWGTR